MRARSPEMLHALFRAEVVVELDDIRAALGDASRATAFRYLQQVPYRRSYNRNGRYYMRHDPARYDRFGLFSHQGILFSHDGSLTSTLVRLVREAEAGQTQRELREMLRVRVQGLLLETVRRGTIDRQRLDNLLVYVHTDAVVRQAQLQRRSAVIAQAAIEAEVTDAVVIQVLLTLVHYPGSKAVDVVRHLYGHSPPITMGHVRAVFDRYDLEHLGEKGGSSRR